MNSQILADLLKEHILIAAKIIPIAKSNGDITTEMKNWYDNADKISKQKNTDIDYQIIFGADHFFREKTDELVELVSNYINHKIMSEQPRKAKPDRRRRQPSLMHE